MFDEWLDALSTQLSSLPAPSNELEVEMRWGAVANNERFQPCLTPFLHERWRLWMQQRGVTPVKYQDVWYDHHVRARTFDGGVECIQKQHLTSHVLPSWGVHLTTCRETPCALPETSVSSSWGRLWLFRRGNVQVSLNETWSSEYQGTCKARLEWEFFDVPIKKAATKKHQKGDWQQAAMDQIRDLLQEDRDLFFFMIMWARLQQLFPPLSFPLRWGDQPQVLQQTDLPQIRDLAVTPKIDGIRQYLFILDPLHSCFVHRNGKMERIQLCQPNSASHCNIHNVLLDGEWLPSGYWIFDVLFWNKPMFKLPLWKRHDCLGRIEFQLPHWRSVSIHCKPFFYPSKAREWPWRRVPEFVRFGQDQLLLSWNAEAQAFPTDGLVFADTHFPKAFKWRPFYTVDLLAKDGVLYAQQGTNLVAADLNVSDEKALPNGVHEFISDQGVWRPLKPRPDKMCPNQWSPTIEDVLQAIREPVTLETLQRPFRKEEPAMDMLSSMESWESFLPGPGEQVEVMWIMADQLPLDKQYTWPVKVQSAKGWHPAKKAASYIEWFLHPRAAIIKDGVSYPWITESDLTLLCEEWRVMFAIEPIDQLLHAVRFWKT